MKKFAAQEAEKCAKFPELCRSDVSVHPSYTELLTFPYDVICRRRLVEQKRKFDIQVNNTINHMIATKIKAMDGLRLELLFSFNDYNDL